MFVRRWLLQQHNANLPALRQSSLDLMVSVQQSNRSSAQSIESGSRNRNHIEACRYFNPGFIVVDHQLSRSSTVRSTLLFQSGSSTLSSRRFIARVHFSSTPEYRATSGEMWHHVTMWLPSSPMRSKWWLRTTSWCGLNALPSQYSLLGCSITS